MLAMDQFKDVGGFVRYASRLRVGTGAAIAAWLAAGWDETLGGLLGKIGPRQVRIRQRAIGVNYIDTYDRSGLYPVSLPSGLGREAAGVVTEAGRSVTALRGGDRVAYGASQPGAYAEERVMDAARVVKVPDAVSDTEAAALMLKGLTAWFLLRRCYRLRRNEFALLHALTDRPGAVLSRAQLEEKLYGWNEEVESNTVEVYVHSLRRKLGQDFIRNVRGVGYMIPKQR